MHDDIQWLIGILASAFVAFAGMLFVAFRNLSTKWTTSTAALHHKIDDVKEKYVRRDDLNHHIGRIDTIVKEVRDEQKALGEEQRRQHLKVLEAIATAANRN